MAASWVTVAAIKAPVYFLDPNGDLNFARYQLGRWRGTNRWRGYVLQRRRSRRPYLEAGSIRVPVRIAPRFAEEPGEIF
jgi:hypothetical protein